MDYRPIGYKNLTGFLERFGCDDLEDFLNVTLAVSLNDTFWVKRADQDICWNQVSLYRNEFDQHTRIAAPQEHLEALSKIVKAQIKAILKIITARIFTIEDSCSFFC